MKKILFAAFAASLLAAGCQKTEIVGTTPVNGPAMTFSTEMKKITKVDSPDAAATETNANLEAQGFNIWAYADYDVTNSTNIGTNGIYDGMFGWFVDYDNGWKPNKKYYWPGTGKDLRFFAVSSITTEEEDGVITSRKSKYTIKVEPGIGTKRGDDTDDGNPSIEINGFVVDKENPDEDLMVADFVKQNQTKDVVTLKFHHTLSKVQFLFKTTPDIVIGEGGQETTIIPDVTVKSIAVEDLVNKCDLTVSKDDKSMNVSLVDKDFLYKYKNDQTDLEDFIHTGDMKLSSDAIVYDTWLMLPQDISEKKIKINYQINERAFEAVFNLTGNVEGFDKWARNQYIKYTIDISPNKIKFTASSSTWTKFDGDGDGNTDSNGDQDKTNDDIDMNN